MKGETEDRVKALLTEGLSNKEIAERVHLSVRAVKWHLENLYSKHGFWGAGSDRRLIALLWKQKLARLTKGAANSIVSASTGGNNRHGDDAAQL